MYRRATLYRYRLPFHSGLILKGQQLTERVGLLIHLIEQQRQGWGEIAPLVGFSQESITEAEQQAYTCLTQWVQGHTVDFALLCPSVAFGISMAEYELKGQLGNTSQFDTVPLCSDSSPSTLAKLQHSSIAKLKIGRHSPKADGITARHLLNALPQLRLRLDANRAWSLDEATDFASQLSEEQRSRIDFIEEPCSTPSASLVFAEQQRIAIAWDETTRERDFTLIKQQNVAAVILKPTLFGSVERCIAFIQQAQQQGTATIISSSLESSLALAQLSQFAAQHTPNTLAGLDTLHLMPYQLLRRWGNSTLPLLDINSPYITEWKKIGLFVRGKEKSFLQI